MPSMRTAVLILMLVLLPLRGWAGAVMVAGHPAPVAVAAAAAESSTDAVPCHGESHAAADEQPAPQTDAGCASCGLCDVCHSPLLGGLWPERLAPPPPTVHPAAAATRFASAPARLLHEPPIA